MYRLIIALVLSASALFAQATNVMIDAQATVTQDQGSNPGSTGFTTTFTVGNHNNRVAYILVSGLPVDSSFTTTYNGVTATLVRSCANVWNCAIYRIQNPTVGAHSFTASWTAWTSAQGYAAQISIFSVWNVDPTTPEDATASAGEGSAATSITTTFGNTVLLAVATCGNPGFLNPQGNVGTQIFTGAGAGGWSLAAQGYQVSVTAGVHTGIGYNCGAQHGVVVAAIKPYLNTTVLPQPQSRINLSVTGPGGVSPRRSLALTPIAITQVPQAPSGDGTATGGDTNVCGWVPPSVYPGSINGGAYICTFNDGQGSDYGCPHSPTNVCVYAITAYNTTTGVATIAGVNSMASHNVGGGIANFTNCYDTIGATHGTTAKSRAPFSMGTLLFMPFICLSGDDFTTRQSGIGVSPDGGAHWCNYKTYLAHSGSPGCDASNWKADGDFPVDAAGYQWPLIVNYMGDLQNIDLLCQGADTNCVYPQALDPLYLYFQALDVNKGIYIHRVLKSLGMGIMNPINWQGWANGTWDTSANAVNVNDPNVVMNMCCSRIQYLSALGKFISIVHASNFTNNQIATAPAPWGPWTFEAHTLAMSNSATGFPSFLGGSCPRYDTSTGKVTCTVASNNNDGGNTLYLTEVQLLNIIPPAMGVR